MKKALFFALAASWGLGLIGSVWSQTLPTILARTAPAPGYEILKVHSPAVAASLLGDSGDLSLHIVLPKGYAENPAKRYPVVYFLHGFGDNIADVGGWKTALRQAQKPGQETLFVGVDGRSALTGAFWTNSPVSGRWEDFLLRETVPLIDREYRTLARSASRGIAGFSMGGSGALTASFRHPDVFGAVAAVAPGLLAPGAFQAAWEGWESFGDFQSAYAAAWSPDPKNTDQPGRFPQWNGTPTDNAVIAQLEAGFGNLAARVATFQTLKTPLRGIRLHAGTRDEFTWIPQGCTAFSELLTKAGITHTFTTHSGGHVMSPSIAATVLIPFFSQTLEYQP